MFISESHFVSRAGRACRFSACAAFAELSAPLPPRAAFETRGTGGEKHKSVGKTGLCLMGKKAFELGAGRRQKQPPLFRRANKQGSCQQPGPGAASSPRGSRRIGEKSRPSPSVARQAWLSQGLAYGTGETQGKAAEGPGYLLTHRTTVLTGTAGLIKLGVNNGAEPPVSPAAVGALGGGGQTPFISGAGAGRVAKGKGLMGLHAFLHGGELGCCRRTNNFLADAPRATSDIEYSWSAAGHFSPHRPPPRSLSSRGYLPAEGPGRDVSPPACCTEPVRPEATGSRGAAKGVVDAGRPRLRGTHVS